MKLTRSYTEMFISSTSQARMSCQISRAGTPRVRVSMWLGDHITQTWLMSAGTNAELWEIARRVGPYLDALSDEELVQIVDWLAEFVPVP